MARIVARNARLLADGYDLSGRSNSITYSLTAEAPEVTAFTEDTRTRLAGGLKDVELSVDGFFDSGASQTDQLFSSMLGGSQIWSVWPSGYAASQVGKAFAGIMTEYSADVGVEDALTVSVTVTGSNWQLRGLSLGEYEAASAASGSVALSSVDFAGSAGSLRAVLHYLDISGSVVAASLQHSNDDSSFTTLIEFGESSSTAKGTAVSASATSASRYRRLKLYLGAGGSAHLAAICQK